MNEFAQILAVTILSSQSTGRDMSLPSICKRPMSLFLSGRLSLYCHSFILPPPASLHQLIRYVYSFARSLSADLIFAALLSVAVSSHFSVCIILYIYILCNCTATLVWAVISFVQYLVNLTLWQGRKQLQVMCNSWYYQQSIHSFPISNRQVFTSQALISKIGLCSPFQEVNTKCSLRKSAVDCFFSVLKVDKRSANSFATDVTQPSGCLPSFSLYCVQTHFAFTKQTSVFFCVWNLKCVLCCREYYLTYIF